MVLRANDAHRLGFSVSANRHNGHPLVGQTELRHRPGVVSTDHGGEKKCLEINGVWWFKTHGRIYIENGLNSLRSRSMLRLLSTNKPLGKNHLES